MAGATYLVSRLADFSFLVPFISYFSQCFLRPFNALILILLWKQILGGCFFTINFMKCVFREANFRGMVLQSIWRNVFSGFTINLMKCTFREALDSSLVADDGIRYTWEVWCFKLDMFFHFIPGRFDVLKTTCFLSFYTWKVWCFKLNMFFLLHFISWRFDVLN